MSRNPFDEIERMFDRMSRQLEPLEDELLEQSVAVDVEDADGTYVVTADLPGYEKGDIDVELAGDRLTLSASHTETTETESDDESGGQYIQRERRQRSVSRSVRLPEPVEGDAAEAEYHNGVLTVTLPKEDADSDGRNIPIN